jgi:hypothetical protein
MPFVTDPYLTWLPTEAKTRLVERAGVAVIDLLTSGGYI